MYLKIDQAMIWAMNFLIQNIKHFQEWETVRPGTLFSSPVDLKL